MIFFIVECEKNLEYNNHIKQPIGHKYYVIVFQT